MHRVLIHQLDQAVTEVFGVMLKVICTSEPLDQPTQYSFAGFVTFSGSFVGVCTLAFDRHTAAEVTADLIGLPSSRISPELCSDAAAELCNMIAGCLKGSLSQTDGDCYLSYHPVTSGLPFSGPTFHQRITRLYRFGKQHQFTVTLNFN